jgi:hypothetical protein
MDTYGQLRGAAAAKIPEIIRRPARSAALLAAKPKRLPLPNIIFEIWNKCVEVALRLA